MKSTIIGFNIGGSKHWVVERDFDGHIYQKRVFLNSKDQTFDTTCANMVQIAYELIQSSLTADRKPSWISVSNGGPLDIDTDIIKSPPNLPGWINILLKDNLKESLRLPIFIQHYGNAGALAEHRFGAGRGTKNLIFLTLGTGLESGLILNGRDYIALLDWKTLPTSVSQESGRRKQLL